MVIGTRGRAARSPGLDLGFCYKITAMQAYGYTNNSSFLGAGDGYQIFYCRSTARSATLL